MLTVQNLSKKFGQSEVLHQISFAVKRNSIVGLLGPNGAGKTTTMRLITGFLSPNGGQIFWNDEDITSHPAQSKSVFGYLPENNPLYDFFTPYEYLTFIRQMRHRPEDNLEKTIKVCGLLDVGRQKIETLSRGYKQRVGLAASLIGDPEVLILDEPTTGLDPNQREEIKKLIKKLNRTTLFSSHVLPEVKDICEEAIIINRGRIISQGKISSLTKKGGVTLEATIKTGSDKEKPTVAFWKKLQEIAGPGTEKPIVKNGVITVKIVRPKNADKVREYIFRLCAKNHWQLYELKETEKSLEEVFQKLTRP